MALNGQSSGGWTGSSSALRLLHVGIRNSTGTLTDDAFNQTNPPIVTTASTVSAKADISKLGVLAGSVAFTRPDVGSTFVGGVGSAAIINASGTGGSLQGDNAIALQGRALQPVGVFLNAANGNVYENLPGQASGIGTYHSGMGTAASGLYETQALATINSLSQGDDLPYQVGVALVASLNGYLMPQYVWDGGNTRNADIVGVTAQATARNTASTSTVIGILKMAADSVQNEIVFDQRI